MKLKLSKFDWTDYELFFVLYFSWIYIVNPVAGLFRSFLGNTHSLEVLILDVFLLILFINISTKLFKRISIWQIVSIIFLLILLLFSFLFSTDTKTNSVVLKRVLTEGCPIFILAGCVRDYDKVYRYLVTLMIIYAYVGFFIFRFLNYGALSDDANYSAEMTYLWLSPAIVLLYDVVNHFTWRSLIPLLISVFSVIGFGSRGPVVCIALSLIFFVILKPGSLKNNVKMIVPAVLLAVFFIINSERIINVMTDSLLSSGLTIRSLTSLGDEAAYSEDARARIIQVCIARFNSNPLVGTGLVNDRMYIKNFLASYDDAHGWYPHNFILEILMQFGFVLGIILLLVLLIFFIHCLRRSPTTEARAVLIIFIGTYLFPLLFSGSYLEWKGFYALMGLSGYVFALSGNKLRGNKQLDDAREN